MGNRGFRSLSDCILEDYMPEDMIALGNGGFVRTSTYSNW